MKLLLTLDFPPAQGGIQKYLSGIVQFCYNKEDAVFVAGIPCPARNPLKVKTRIQYFSSPFDFIDRKISLLLLFIPYFRLCKRSLGNLFVECGNIYAAFVPWLLYGITKQPYQIYTYGTELIGLQKNSIKSMILKNILYKAEKVFTLGKYSEEILKKLNIATHIDRVPPRIVLPNLSEVARVRQKDRFRILCVGRLVKHKGHSVLIHAAKLLAKENKHLFVIIGSGPEHKNLLQLTASLHLENLVSIKQNLSDELAYKEFNESDIFVLPSFETAKGTEGFGIVLLEAMAFHLPIIASATGGIPEVLDNGTCGILVEPNNAQALADAIRSLSENRSLAEKISQKAYNRLMDNYVWK